MGLRMFTIMLIANILLSIHFPVNKKKLKKKLVCIAVIIKCLLDSSSNFFRGRSGRGQGVSVMMPASEGPFVIVSVGPYCVLD